MKFVIYIYRFLRRWLREITFPTSRYLWIIGTMLLVGPIVLSPLNPVFASDAGQTAAEVLRFGSGARIPAMGGAGVASVSGPSSLHYNPAGLAHLPYTTGAEITYQSLVEDINLGNIDFAKNVTGSRGVFAGGLRFVDYGGQDRIEFKGGSDPDDLTTVGSFTNNDLVLTGGYARRLSQTVSMGIGVKVIRQELAGVRASAVAGDLGVQWRSSNAPLGFGVSVANLGTDLTFDEVDEPLPALARAGLSYNFAPLDLRLNLDGELTFDSSEFGFRGGVERWFWETLVVRAGYDGNVDVDNGITGGIGFRFGRNRFDYAILPFDTFGSVHRFSLIWRF